MSLTEIQGNLFSSKAQLLFHGCNTKGKMFAGIAREFYLLYPEMFKEYKKSCDEGSYNVGDCQIFVSEKDNRVIANLATQDFPGKDARLYAVEESFEKLCIECNRLNIHSIAGPRIGCGIGGLSWGDVRTILANLADKYNITLEIYYL
jgi:O-acetyl-ADP-ribose deacetylase (regulator of RNase III)